MQALVLPQSRNQMPKWCRPPSAANRGSGSFSRRSRSTGGAVLSRRRLRRTSTSSAVSEAPRPQALRDFQVHHWCYEPILSFYALMVVERKGAWQGIRVLLYPGRFPVCSVVFTTPLSRKLKRNRRPEQVG